MTIFRDAKDLTKVSKLAHSLKGSSGQLGLVHVMDVCEKMQHYGEENASADNDEVIKEYRDMLDQAQSNYKDAKAALKRYYHDQDS